uniref:Transcription factor domain-containing protein n=1 Tax=Talaromyces marneffei PM1 TaxID=1077442 RepID=A0A093VAG9_TALMA
MSDYVNPRAHACQNCVKAKAKCYDLTDGRCERIVAHHDHQNPPSQGSLSRTACVPGPAINTRCRRNDQALKIIQLEQKLNSLVSLLGSSQQNQDHGAFNAITPESTGPTSSASESMSAPIQMRQPIPQCFPTTQQQYELGSPLFALPEGRTNKSPDDLLDIFRRDMAHQAPFISVPVQMSAQALARERPVLYRAIMTVTSYHDSVYQLHMGQELVKYMMERLILLGEKSLDLLQGLLIYINWYNSLFHANPQTNTLLGLAFSLLVDLNLYVPYKSGNNHEKFVGEMKVTVTSNPNWARSSEPSREERRAVLGCFYLFSCVSSKFRSLNPLHWTTNIQQCYEEILKAPEYENDLRLVHLVDLQRIAENTKYILDREFPSSNRSVPNASVGLHLKLLVSDLEKFKVTLPERFQQDSIMMMHYHAVEILVFELCFFMSPTAPAQGLSPNRADALWMCLTATRTLINIYFSLHSPPHVSFSAITLQQLYLALATLSKLLLFKADDWDVNYAQPSVDLSTLLDSLVTRTEDLSARYDLMENNKPWLQTSRRFRQVRTRFDDLLSNENVSPANISTVQSSSNGLLLSSYHEFRLDQFGLWDDRFWPTMQDDPAQCSS